MRFLSRTAAPCGALVVGLAAVWVGCAKPPREGLVLRPMPVNPDQVHQTRYRVRAVRLVHRMRPDTPVEDIWRLLGTTSLPYEKWDLWQANDLRLGDGARLAAERLNELLVQTPDRTAHVVELVVTENLDFRLTVGLEQEGLDLLWTDAAGRICGRQFTEAQPAFRVVCRSDPQQPDAVRVALVPEVVYGKEAMRWVRTERGIAQQPARSRFTLQDLAAEVRLAPGRLLVVGGERRSPVSLGGAFFFEQRGPDLWAQTIILTVDRLAPAEVPEGTKVPFLARPEEP